MYMINFTNFGIWNTYNTTSLNEVYFITYNFQLLDYIYTFQRNILT